jgi:hypothetical protein
MIFLLLPYHFFSCVSSLIVCSVNSKIPFMRLLIRIITVLMITAMLFVAACTQKEKKNALPLDEDLDELNNTNNVAETTPYVYSGVQRNIRAESDHWTGGYLPTDGRFWFDYVYSGVQRNIRAESDHWTGGYWPTEGKFWFNEKDRTITGFTDGKSVVVIPARIMGVPVEAIGDGVFQGKDLTSVTLFPGLISIGSNAFKDNKLSSITIPEGVMYIGDGAFEGNLLVSVSIPTGTFVDYSAFSSTSNDPITFVLGTDIHFQTNIHSYLAYYEYLCNDRKAGTYNEVTYASPKEGDFEFIQTRYGTIITGHIGGKVDRLEIPRQLGEMAVKGIIREAFSYNDISSVQLPDGLIFIGGISAFSNNKLTSVTIPDSVIYIGDYAFSGNQLTSVDIGKNVSSINKGAFFNNPLTNITIPDSVTYIGDGAFEGNQLTSVTIPNGVTSIGINVFLNNQLTVVVIPDSVVSIDSGAFGGNKLTSVTIGGDVKLSGGDTPSFDRRFDNTYNDNRKRAGSYIYNDYYWSMTVPPVNNENDFEIDGRGEIIHYTGTITKYTGSDIFITIPSQIGGIPIRAIGISVFVKKELISVTIPEGVVYIGPGAFRDNKLTSIIIPDSVIDIDASAFDKNPLRKITIGSDVWMTADRSWPSINTHFIAAYRANGEKAGTYVEVWEGGMYKGWKYVDE